MNEYLKILEQKRLKLLSVTQDLNNKQYNKIPAGFNNNIIWNMGHLLTVSERILYEQLGVQRPDHDFPLAIFNKGTRPDLLVEPKDILYIRKALLDAVITLAARPDFTIDLQIMRFLFFHEDYHYKRVAELMNYV